MYTRRCRRLVLALTFAAALPGAEFDFHVPKGFPLPSLPPDNPMNAAKVELGRYLFYDKRMSVNGKKSCGSCHRQELAFTDGHARAEGTTGQLHPRGSMSLVNVAYAAVLTWVNPMLHSLEQQALIPMLGDDPIELGLKGHEGKFLNYIKREPVYRRLFPQAFEGDVYSLTNVTKAIAAFERTIISMRSPYDRYRWGGEMSAISDSAKRGEILFFSGERAGCFQCHAGWNFTGDRFFYIGVEERGAPRYRAPTMRNIAVTAPYMHDGSVATLEEAIGHAGAGRVMVPFSLTDSEKHDLVEFLKSLTDQELLHDPRWSDPWKRIVVE